jgi:2-methylcitrate dehydratase PrpD
VEITRGLARFIACTPGESIPEGARLQAKRAFLDTIGVLLAGSREGAGAIIAARVREDGGSGEASVLGHGFRAPAGQAALANGVAAHALDYDDVTVNMRGHPSVPLVPAVLALAEKHGLPGRDLLDAYVLGFEAQCKLGRAIGEPHYALGWHATSTLGTLGAAAACARLLGLDAQRTGAALGIAASLAGGVVQNFGTMTKPLHAGRAAENGVAAAQLAQAGFTASDSALEGPAGFLRVASGGAEIDPSAAVRGLGDPWEVLDPGIAVKLYPCCYAIARAVDAAIELHGAIEGEIERAGAVVSPGTLIPLIDRLPETPLEARFSFEYCLASALIDGRLALAAFTPDAVRRPDVRALAARITVREEGEPRDFPVGGLAELRVTAGGRTQTRIVDAPRGDARNPLTWEELAAKFRDCAGGVLGDEVREEAIDIIGRLEMLSDVHELIAVIEG